MFDNFDDEFEDDFEDFDSEDDEELEDFVDEMVDRKDEIRDRIDEVRDNVDELGDLQQQIEDVKRMREDIVRMQKDMSHQMEELQRLKSERRRTSRPPRPPRAPRYSRSAMIDLSPLTESLDDMMSTLGEEIEHSLEGIGDIKIPKIRLSSGSKRKRRRSKTRTENIPPERVARIVAPLGSEERLKILEYLKSGPKSFNELESYTGKTGSSLTHHLNPLLDVGFVIKGEVRGTYYITVEGNLAYRLAQWLTGRLEQEISYRTKKKEKTDEYGASNDSMDSDGPVAIVIEDEDADETALDNDMEEF